MGEMVIRLIQESFEAGELDTEALLIEMPYLYQWVDPDQYSPVEALFRKHLPAADVEIVLLYFSVLSKQSESAKTKLEELANTTPAPRYVNQVLATIATDAKLYSSAYEYFLEEGKFAEAEWAREQAVVNRHYVGDFKELESLSKDLRYSDAFKPWIRSELTIRNRDWFNSIRWVALGQFYRIEAGSFILATIAMIVWGTILLQLCQATRLDRFTPFLCLAALVLGALSTTPTLLWVILEDMYLPISEGEDLLHSIVYFIATVGLREEVCKLLLFLPLAPLLIRRGNELEYLLVASFVGLGFAYEENFSYLASSMGTGSTARFLTANFLHISLTGMSGLFFCRWWSTRGFGFNDFMFIFGIAIVAHGLYDALLTHPPLDDGGISALILFILFSKFYFQEAHNLREKSEPTISLSGTMAFGISLLSASLIVYLSIILNLSQAISLSFSSFLGSAIILFMFFREFNERIGD